MALVSFNEDERLLGRGRALILATGRAGQVIEVGEVMGPAYSTIAHQKVEEFVPLWVKIRERWLKAGAPGSVITDTYPVVTPQVVSKWRRAFVKPEYLSPQIAEAPLMAKAREVRRKVLDTFPTLKYILEGE